LPSLFLHDVFASRHLHIQLLRNDYTVPTRCRHRGGIVDHLGCKACRAIRQPNQPIQSDTGSLDPKSSKTSQFSVIRRFIGIESHASESYYHSYTVATSGVAIASLARFVIIDFSARKYNRTFCAWYRQRSHP
jgi:hypothetical protein